MLNAVNVTLQLLHGPHLPVQQLNSLFT